MTSGTIEPARLSPRLTETADASGESTSFSSAVGGALDQLSAADNRAARAAEAAATGDVASVGEYMVAATEAQLTAELTVAVRNRAVEAFNDIMRMQV
ncbi:MAG: flagellar hook-basal body complex protein FliE [Acidimicrobiia bacterium]|nr:flagellar hook-basal body complex protein FliE [Acidimicrobiia bacterium]